MSNSITNPAYTVNPDTAEFHITDGNAKLGDEFTICYSTIPGAGRPKWADGREIVDVSGTCAGCSHACQKHCYAMASLRRFANSCAPAWGENTVIVREDPGKMSIALFNKIKRRRPLKYVRFHVAGEFDAGTNGRCELFELVKLANSVKDRGVIIYGYTKRTDLLLWYESAFGEFPDNLVIIASQWRNELGVESVTNYTNAPEFHYHDPRRDNPEIEAMPHCPAVDRNGRETGITCEQCGMCQHARKGDKIAVYAH